MCATEEADNTSNTHSTTLIWGHSGHLMDIRPMFSLLLALNLTPPTVGKLWERVVEQIIHWKIPETVLCGLIATYISDIV